MTFEVGQELYFVPSGRGNARHVYVTSIGRKWVNTSDGQRFDSTNMRVDGKGFSSPGRVYLNVDEYRAHTELSAKWSDFVTATGSNYSVPRGMSIAKLDKIIALIKDTSELVK